jgi:hypothetical protein
MRAFGPGLRPCRCAADLRWRPRRGRRIGEVGGCSEGLCESFDSLSFNSCDDVEDSLAEEDTEDSELDCFGLSSFSSSGLSCFSSSELLSFSASRYRFGAVFEREILVAWDARLGRDAEVCNIGGGGGCVSSGGGWVCSGGGGNG